MNNQNIYEELLSKGIIGLKNRGNTCFMNSCMQILSHTYELNELLESGNYKKKLIKEKSQIKKFENNQVK